MYVRWGKKGASGAPSAVRKKIAGPQDDGMAALCAWLHARISIVSWSRPGTRGGTRERERVVRAREGTQGGGGGNVERVKERQRGYARQ